MAWMMPSDRNPDTMIFFRVHTVRKNQERKYVFKGSQEKSGKVMKCQEILLKLEKSQEKVRKLYQSSEFCGAQL